MSDSDRRYETLGRQIESMLVTDYIELLGNPRRLIWNSFIRGIFAGLGGVIGATVMVGILLYLLGLLGGAPWVGHYLNNLANTIKQ